ncbi:MAG: phosphonate C-P lyase system protein PhnH [Pseudomonadota bacterium]
MSATAETVLAGGFADIPIDAAHGFRAAMTAMARPGRVTTVAGAAPPAPVSPAAGVLILTLCDAETPLFLAPSHDTAAMRNWLAFHTGVPLVAPEAADFALGAWADLPLSRMKLGRAEYPDRSCTVIVEMPELVADTHRLVGPGIETEAFLRLPETGVFQANRRQFPLGLDFFFTAGNQLAALPRTTRIEEVA